MSWEWGVYLASLLGAIGLEIWAAERNCIGKGKYITWPWVKWWMRRNSTRILKKKLKENPELENQEYFQIHVRMTPGYFRWRHQMNWFFSALVFLLLVDIFVHGVPPLMFCLVYFWPVSALYADDLISTIDKDKWKKRWDSVKNKVKWKWTPAPVPQVSRG